MQIGIIGGGESGVGAALLALKVGDVPYVSDFGQINPVYRQNLIENHVPFEEGGHTFDMLAASDIIVKSPGISDKTPIIKRLLAHGAVVISEVEYASRYCHGKVIAITGSNGKTTTTNLIHHLLCVAGRDAVKGGNLGTSFSNLLLDDEHDYYVIEVSSFQLDNILSFRPDIAVLTNITPDHLDRYEYNIDLYADSKFRITENQSADDYLVYASQQPLVTDRLESVSSQLIEVSSDDLIVDRYAVDNPSLRGLHNRLNASCAIEVMRLLGVSDDDLERGLNSFINDDHRLQTVALIKDVEWINDSKATNVDAVWYALDAMTGPTIWIAGGVDKGNDYTVLYEAVDRHVKMLICLGADNQKLVTAFEGRNLKTVETQSISEAIAIAADHADSGDTVLLSPACASFDLFENYMDRGDQFVAGVQEILRKRT